MAQHVSDQGDEHADDSLDPSDWDTFRQTAHDAIDRMIDHLKSLRDQPAWQPMPKDIRQSFEQPVPTEGIGNEAALDSFFQRVLPYSNGNQHPRFWGFVQGTGLPLAALGDFLASMMNAHLAGFDQAPARVEEEVIRWLAELIGFPSSSRGLLTSGGTMAGLLAMAVARHDRAGFDVREQGVLPSAKRPIRIYASTQTHHWLVKSVEALGLGRGCIHEIDVDDQYRLRVDVLARAIEQDIREGKSPLAIVANVGTVQTGAIDPLQAIAPLARTHRLWLHIDGAFGLLARLSPKLAPLLEGIEHADSVAFDLHKWMYIPFESACVLIRQGDLAEKTFAWNTPYLARAARGVAAGGTPLADRGIELSRSFKALKVWLILQSVGARRLGEAIHQNVLQAKELALWIDEHPSLERMAPAPLNIVCFRFVAEGESDERLDQVNEEILYRVQESGLAVPSSTKLGKRYVLRVAIVNHRTRRSDLKLLIDAVVKHGETIIREGNSDGGKLS
ncbi:amino acid decarboxylase [bacterium]|nr:amino acid decarboxylase [bacterium]